VYVCDLTRQEPVGLRQQLRVVINQREDRISIFNLGPVAGRNKIKVEHLGRRSPLHGHQPDDAVVW
jgi:CRISPR/Cas system-associated endoribonuclease Cas2